MLHNAKIFGLQVFNSRNYVPENSVNLTLEGLDLQKYSNLFTRKHIHFDTFLNMTREDLVHIGITNEEDQNTILKGTEHFKSFYKYLNEPDPPNLDDILGNNLHHIKVLLGLMVTLRQRLRREKPGDLLLDNTHPASTAMALFLERIQDELDFIKEDIVLLNEVQEIKSKKADTSKSKFYIAFGVAALLTTSIVLFKCLR